VVAKCISNLKKNKAALDTQKGANLGLAPPDLLAAIGGGCLLLREREGKGMGKGKEGDGKGKGRKGRGGREGEGRLAPHTISRPCVPVIMIYCTLLSADCLQSLTIEPLQMITTTATTDYFESNDTGPYAEHIKRQTVRQNTEQETEESRAVARKPRDAAAVLFGLKFTDNIHYKFKSSQASKARLQSSTHTGAKQNLTQRRLKVIQSHRTPPKH